MGKVKPKYEAPKTVTAYQMRGNGFLSYDEYIDPPRKNTVRNLENQKNLTRGTFNGFLSDKTKRDIRKYLNNWMQSINVYNQHYKADAIHKQCTFVTLTLPSAQKHDDNYIKRNLLMPLITNAKRFWKVKNYFWRAEAQENGNIHFHLLFDRYCPYWEVRDTWNKLADRHGYIQPYRERMEEHHSQGFTMSNNANDKRNEAKQYEAYLHGVATNWSSPNSTDIHALRKVKNISAYVTKYATKDNLNARPIAGRLWGASDTLKNAAYMVVREWDGICDELEDALKLVKPDIFHGDNFTFIRVDMQSFLKKHCPQLYDQWQRFYLQQYRTIYGALNIPKYYSEYNELAITYEAVGEYLRNL